VRNTTEILGIPIDIIGYGAALDKLEQFMGEDGTHLVVTPNPEMIMKAQKDARLKEILCSAALSAPDGVGVVLASRLTDKHIPERVTGCDLMPDLLGRMAQSGKTAYFLGAKEGVAEQAKVNMENRYPGLKIIGTHHGYLKADDDKLIVEELMEKKPDLLMVGMSADLALNWVYDHKELGIPVIACIGGTLDILAGTVTRAPAVFRKLGLEWFYRLVSQPSRASRMLQLPVFAAAALREKFARHSSLR